MKHSKFFKRTLTMLLSAVVAGGFTACSSGTPNETEKNEEIIEKVVEDTLTWSVENSVLTISGTGPMKDYEYGSPSPWSDENFTAVVIEEGVTSIGDRAFQSNTKLTKITIPSSVVHIGDYAISYCDSLKKIEIPSTVTSMGKGVFSSCPNLKTVALYASAELSDNIFSGCQIQQLACGQYYSFDKNGLLYNRDKTVLYGAVNTEISTAFIAETVTSIGDNAFFYCEYLRDITIPNSVTSIGAQSFAWCFSLTDVTLPSGVTSIGDYAFNYCENLERISIPNSVKNMGTDVFPEHTEVIYAEAE